MDTPKEEGVIMDEDLVLTFYYAKKVNIKEQRDEEQDR